MDREHLRAVQRAGRRVASDAEPAWGVMGGRPAPRVPVIPAYRINGDRHLLEPVCDFVDPETGKAVLNHVRHPASKVEFVNGVSDSVRRTGPGWKHARSAAPAVDRVVHGEPKPPVKPGMGFIERNQQRRAELAAADLERRFEALRRSLS